ncbi:GNAT family N-acetyltransferase [Nocardiopsis sp. RSe5-2]|uniref:GNAT family N-acetyltransferase n=1 Tax=Nocardiopsis endophytica TaxID=3018445 RepID=A0ABT4U9C7_9ACTN|nr:GNAT family N-acetyltransferase [Nocardiopsis endophytica]MDA2813554.1 GNAT family N-acetyltransferase [Nocardiopsis endophytica]
MTAVVPGFDEKAWSLLEHGSPLQSPAWLRAMGGRLPGAPHTVVDGADVGFFGAVVTDPDAYEAYNPRAVLWRDPPVFPVPDPVRRARRLEELPEAPGRALPALVLVAPGYLGDPAGRRAERADAVGRCLSGAAEWGRANGMAALYVLYTRGAAVEEAVAGLGGVSFPLTERCAMPVWWDGWESYLAGLAPGRRREVRRERRRAEEAGVEAVRVDPRSDFDRILQGRCSLLERYGQRADADAERGRLERLLAEFGTDLTAYGARHDGELVSSCIAVRTGRTMHVVYTGASEAAERLPFAHFMAAYYAIVDHTGRSLLDEIDYGIGHTRGKVLRGCTPAPLRGHAVALEPAHADELRRAAAALSEPVAAAPAPP